MKRLSAAIALVAIASCRGAELGPGVPPALAFDLLRGSHRSIYRVRSDGSDTLCLTPDSADNRQPTSAAGTIVFVSSRDGNAELYSMPNQGGTATRLTFTTANEADPALSPDGTKLAYTRDDGGLPRLWIGNADASGAVRVTDSLDFGGAVDASPAWGPASDKVVFVSTTSGLARLYQLTLAGMTIAPVLSDTAPDVEPSVSPEGTLLAFVSGANGGARVAMLDVAQHKVNFLTTAGAQNGQPTWLADSAIVFLQRGATPALAVINPLAPLTVQLIDVGPGTPGHPAPIRPND